MGNPLSRFFRSLSRGCVSWTLIVLVFWPFLASPAQAQLTIVGDVPRQTDNLVDTIFTTLTRAAMVGLFNALQTFLGQIAYDAADYIATGSSGQAATYYKKSIGSYLAGVASDSMGEFIGSLSSEEFFRTAGFDLCKPSANTILRLQLSLGNFFPGMQGRFQRPQPRCDFKDIIKNYDTLYQSLSNADVLKNVQLSVNTNSSDLGATLNILNQARLKVNLDTASKKADRQEGGGFKSITNILSGNVKTPAQVVNESARTELVKFPKDSLLTTIGATLSSGMQQGFIQLAAYTASIFVNTLASKLLKRIFEGGLDDGVAQLQLSPDQVTQTRPTDTRNLAVSLKTPNLQKVENFDVVTELASCPNETRGTWNCTIDQGLRSALVRNDQGGVTVRAALASGLLHGGWQLIPASDLRRNQDRNCYTQAYCAGNLNKLRLLRMLPVGFELAANSAENARRCGPQGSGCVTLQEVVDGFNACSGPEATPWCHLIDPDWILTALPQQCVLKGYGDQLLSSTLGQRREECQDVQTCLRRNDQGDCVGGYGYCVADKTVYRFGADECLPRQASCRTYQTRGGGEVSYLRNTTDQATCSADNVGCLWYATTRDPARGEEGWIGTTSTGPRIYLNAKVSTCGADGEGCTKVREAVVGQSSLNLIINPSFEQLTDATPPALKGWIPLPVPPGGIAPAVSPTVAVGDAQMHGSHAADLNVTGGARIAYFQGVSLNPSRSYVLSFFARLKAAGRAARANVLVSESSSATTTVAAFDARAFKSSGCAVVSGVRVPGISAPAAGQTLSTDWQRFECTFITTSSTKAALVSVFGDPTVLDSNALVDDIQLEEGEFATDFIDGFNASLVERHLKIAPDDFACTGEDTDPAICDRFAKVCRQTEAGCDGYTDAVAGGNEIPAILSTNDLCPSECVGYAEYRKSPSAFDLTEDPDERFSDPGDASSSYFIASSAASCRREEVGCEAFTNVEGTSGEQQAYLTYARSCRKPGPASQTFFTWEGSDTSGYQLRTWSLVHDTATPPGPIILTKREPGSLSVKEPSTCNEPTWRTALDPDCRQFYDADGHVFYRYYSQTILSTPGCTDFRVARSSRADCQKTDGTFDASANECLYHVYLPLSQLCTASAVGCREYRGVTAGANLSVVSQGFRGATDTRGFVGSPASALHLSNETLLVGDQSLRLDVPVRGASVRVPFVSPRGDNQYSVTFWAKPALATSTLQLTVGDLADPSRTPVAVGSVLLTTDWQRYTVGPFFGYAGAPTSTLTWTAVGNPSPYVVFLDEVSLVRIQDRTYVRRETWNTPAVCDRNAYDVPQPQAMLGCRAYRRRDGQSVDVKDFTRLCRQAAIGCKGFIDTRNSTDVGEQTFERGDTPTIPGFGTAITKRPADRMIYLIDEPSKRCTSDQDSCRALGKPDFSPDRLRVSGFTTVYVKDDITRYDQMLCRPSELFCEQFTYNGSNEYFRNPDNHTCEYREQVTNVLGVPGGTYSGWFVTGSNPPVACYPDLLESGRTFGVARRADPGYAGWVGMCEPEADECTEIRDPMDTSDPDHPSGKPYYFIRNEHLDATTCAGNVDRANGCILMRDTGSEDLRYHTRATYSYQQGLTPPRAVQPIDCVRNPTDPSCRDQAGRCSGTIKYCPLTDPTCARTPLTPVVFFGATPIGNVWPMTLADVLWRDHPELQSLVRCHADRDCTDVAPHLAPDAGSYYTRTGTCKVENDANLIVKVKLDRDCAQWLGCSSSEVVFDPATNQSRSLCTNLALCDKGKQEAGDQYCDGYVNRASTSTEPILTQGTALTQPLYVSRDVGLGQREYTGYAIPNAFLPVDLVNARVAVDGTGGDVRATSKFARDYRLAAAVPMPPAHEVHPSDHLALCAGSLTCLEHNQPPLQNQAKVLDRRTRLGAAYPDLHLCQHLQTNLIGYFLPEKMSATTTSFCYLASSFDPATVTDPEIRRSPYDFNSLALGFTETNANNDGFVQQAFPAAECRANPEADSPFATDYVTSWDLTKNPPKPTQRVPGFTRVNVCEYGQDCSCTYKRADYSQAAISKFFDANAQTVPSGVCVGGPRDGEACIPGEIANTAGDASGAATPPPVVTGTGSSATASVPERKRAQEASNVSQTCGDPQLGGRCVILSRVETVRGVFGQCLQRDVTRTVALGNTQEQPCLAWNPGPILFGEHDTYHYSPSAGYQPPPGSGQYYCLSATRKPTTMRFDPSDLVGQEPPAPFSLGSLSVTAGLGLAAGAFTGGATNPAALALLGIHSGPPPRPAIFSGRMTKISYDDDYVSRETENASGAASILGQSGKEGQSARNCEDADDEQDIDNQARDIHGLRLVGTGSDIDHSYTEAFFAINQKKYVADLFNQENPGSSLIASGMMDSNIGYIKIQPFENPNGIGRLGCGYQADWVDGAPAVDYDKKDDLRTGDPAWRQKFFENYSSLLTRGSEKYFTKDGGGFVTRPCVKTDPNSSTEPSKTCGFKYWELGYRSEGQTDLFNGAFTGPDRIGYDNGFEELRTRAFSTKCTAEKPYFAIRAVFQAEAVPGAPTAPSGPWRFVGFWVASCAGRVNDVRYMYMTVDVVSADICKELAEVRSKDSLQDAAYTDRVWKNAAYTAPRVGTQYNSKFAPFASAVTSRPITEAGIEPLFQAGGDVAGFSPLHPPTFLAPGSDSYHRPEPLPKDKWAYLSNLFARVYRVYRYYGQSVNLGDRACLDGPFKGEACTPDAAGVVSGPSKQCSIQGVCDTNLLESSAIDSFKMCDSMSGLNAGLSCADDPDVCHTGGVFFDAGGVAHQQLHACVLNADRWRQNDDGTYNSIATAATIEHDSASEASQQYLRDRTISPPFVCRGGMRGGQDCSGIATASRECPEEVLGKCVVPHPAPRTPDHFDVVFGTPVVNVSNSVTSTKCALPRYVRGPDTPGATAGAPDVRGTLHVVRSDVAADGFNPLDHPENVYVDPTTHLVYDVVTNNQYTSCQADYDCSFTAYNYYTKRQDGYPPLYSPRSRVYQWRRGFSKTNYGPVLGSDGGGCTNDTATNECMRETYVDVAGAQGGQRGAGNAYTGGARRAASLLPYLITSNRDSISEVQYNYIVGGVDNRCVIQAWRQGYARSTGDHFDQTNACGQPAPGTTDWYNDDRYQDALVNDTGGTDTISPHVLSELTRDPGVAHPGFRTPPDRDDFDSFLDGTPFDWAQTAQWVNIPFATCASPKDLSRSRAYGRCRGGTKDGSLCRVGAVPGDQLSCEYDLGKSLVPPGAPALPYYQLKNLDDTAHTVSSTAFGLRTLAHYETAVNRCGPVSIDLGGGAGTHSYRPVAACAKDIDSTQTSINNDLDNDNNICTHTAGYKPRVDLCPDPSDEFCGLIAYKRGNVASLTPGISPFPLATDVTVGHYTPDHLMNATDQGPFHSNFSVESLSYINYYSPYPPQVAAVDSGQCRQPGQCVVTRAQTFTFNGQTEGPLTVAGGQHKSTIQFYAWASHNQMPIRRLMIDWGDGFVQSLPDAKIKNHKPFCGGTKECYIVTGPNKGHTGLTCNTDNDCPAGYGRCENMGTCVKQADKTCTQDSDCTNGGPVGDRCNIRQFFGNSPDACEQNYFEFSHVYVCNGQQSVTKSSCEAAILTSSDLSTFRCGRNPEKACGGTADTISCGPGDSCLPDLAPKGGCWDRTAHACRFTPRVLIEDNWGWCTGECRHYLQVTPGVGDAPATSILSDDPFSNTVADEMAGVTHPYGGCYSGMPVNGGLRDAVKLNTDQTEILTDNECASSNPGALGPSIYRRPWIVYPGSIQLRSR